MNYKVTQRQHYLEELSVKRQGHIITLKREACPENSVSLCNFYPKFTPVTVAQTGQRDANIYSPLLV